MPFYTYTCQKCSKDIEAQHPMSLEPNVCGDLPEGSCDCDGEGELKRDYSSSSFTMPDDFEDDGEQETGDVVEETIEETKEEVEQEKQKLKDREFDPKEVEQ